MPAEFSFLDDLHAERERRARIARQRDRFRLLARSLRQRLRYREQELDRLKAAIQTPCEVSQ